MPTLKLVTRHGLVASLVFLVACSPNELAQAQDRERTQTEIREQLGDVPAGLDTATAAVLSGTFRAAADRALPAVVYVRVEQERNVARRGAQQLFPFFNIPEKQFDQPQEGHGSGFIFDQRGHVMTNNHVVRNADRVTVRLIDGREFPAQVVGTDPSTDIAVLKIDPEGEELPVAPMGSSERLRVGDWVLALGSPLGLDFTVTAGIVSAQSRQIGILSRQREVPQGRALEAFIQTDAAINQGNSGGPLVDLLGRVVGVNSAIASPTGVYAGYGFAIPIDLATRVAEDLIAYGVVHRPRLGVRIDAVNAVDAEVYELDRIGGAEVATVQPGTPADEAGVRVGDVIVAVDDRPVRNDSELLSIVAQRKPGERITLTVVRYGERLEIPVELGQFEPTTEPEPGRRTEPDEGEKLGFAVAPLTPELAARGDLDEVFDVEALNGAPVITEASPSSPAVAQGVRAGQIILQINGQEVGSVEDVERLTESIEPGDVVSLLVRDPNNGDMIVNYRVE